jgi:hypothetical protein
MNDPELHRRDLLKVPAWREYSERDLWDLIAFIQQQP